MPDLKEILQSKRVVIPDDYQVFKNIFRHFRGKQIGDIKGDSRPLLERADEFYRMPPKSGLLQGDILCDIPTSWIQNDESGNLSGHASGKGMAMILSSECDCEARDDRSHQAFIRLCPVVDEAILLEDYEGPRRKDAKQNLERNHYTEYFWMPPIAEESGALIADLSHFYSINLDDLHDHLAKGSVKRKVSLSKEGYYLFLMKMAWFMFRPETADGQRKDLESWPVQ